MAAGRRRDRGRGAGHAAALPLCARVAVSPLVAMREGCRPSGAWAPPICPPATPGCAPRSGPTIRHASRNERTRRSAERERQPAGVRTPMQIGEVERTGSGARSPGAFLPAAGPLNIAMLGHSGTGPRGDVPPALPVPRRPVHTSSGRYILAPVPNRPALPARYVTRCRPRPTPARSAGRAPACALQRSDHAMIHPPCPALSRSQVAHLQSASRPAATTKKPHNEFPRLIHQSSSKRNRR